MGRRSVIICVVVIAYQGGHATRAFGEGKTEQIALPQPTNKPATLSFEQLRQGIRQYYQRLRAVEVESEQRTATLSSPEPGLHEAVPRTLYHFAYKGEKRFFSESAPLRGKADPPLQTQLTMAFDGEEERDLQPSNKKGSIFGRRQEFANTCPYLQCLGIPLKDAERALVSETDYFLPFALDNATLDWSVRPTLELIDGVECHVLKSKFKQGIWIDPKTGYGMRFREIYQRIDGKPSDQWPLMTRHRFDSYQKVADAVWLPQRIEILAYYSARAPANLWNRANYHITHEAKKLGVNEQVEDGLFKLTFPAGTLVNDLVRKRLFRIGKADEELDLLVAESEQVLAGPVSRWRRWSIILASLVGMLAIILIVLFKPLIRRRQR
jgi:hypothetical protein